MELNAKELNKKIDEQVGPVFWPSYKWGADGKSVVFKFNQLQHMKRVRDEIGRMITSGARAIALDPKDDPGAYRRYALVIDWKDEDNVNHVIETNLRWLIKVYRMVPDDIGAGGGDVNAQDYYWDFAPGMKGTGPNPKPAED